MTTVSLSELEQAADLVHAVMPATPQYNWPLLSQRVGCDLWVKHENHTPVGAFKVRGGTVFIDDLAANGKPAGIITATRGNHGQSIAFSARRAGIHAVIVVPEGNSVEKNAAMRSLGADLVVHGHDFQAAFEYAQARASDDGLTMVPSFDPRLIRGVGTYGLEFFRAVPDLDAVYVPIGLGSGICGLISARDALGLGTAIIGVVAEGAPSYALSFEAGKPVPTNAAETMADGVACRVPIPEAVETINRGADRVVRVSDAEIKAAMLAYFSDTHNVVEGAGAAPLAAVQKERERLSGRKVGVIATGGNIDLALFHAVLNESSQSQGQAGEGGQA